MIRLQRTIHVETFDVQATVARGRDRPEFLAVARLAADLGRPIDGKIVATELLGGLPAVVGWRVIDRAVALGLLEHPGNRQGGAAALSAAGRAALEIGEVLVPEEDTFRFYYVEDVLVDDPLVHVERVASTSAKDERNTLYQAKQAGKRPERGMKTPAPLLEAARPYEDDSLDLFKSIASGRGFEVRQIAERGEPGPRGTLRLVLEWPSEARPSVSLRGELEAVPPANEKGVKKVPPLKVDHVLSEPASIENITYQEMWRALASLVPGASKAELDSLHARIGRNVFPVSFDARLPEAARRAMRMSLEIPASDFEPTGEFEPTRLADAELLPRSTDDAQRWAEWLQSEAITGYSIPSALVEAAKTAAARFPHHRVQLPDPDTLRARALKTPLDSRSRFLLAPFDLGLWS